MRKKKTMHKLSSVDVRDQWSSYIKINEHYFGHAFNVAHKIHRIGKCNLITNLINLKNCILCYKLFA